MITSRNVRSCRIPLERLQKRCLSNNNNDSYSQYPAGKAAIEYYEQSHYNIQFKYDESHDTINGRNVAHVYDYTNLCRLNSNLKKYLHSNYKGNYAILLSTGSLNPIHTVSHSCCIAIVSVFLLLRLYLYYLLMFVK